MVEFIQYYIFANANNAVVGPGHTGVSYISRALGQDFFVGCLDVGVGAD